MSSTGRKDRTKASKRDAAPPAARVVKRRGILARLGSAPGLLFGLIRAVNRTVVTLVAVVALLLGTYFLLLHRIAPATDGREVDFRDMNALISSGQVTAATLYDEDARIALVLRRGDHVYAAYPKSDAETSNILDGLSKTSATIRIDQQSGKEIQRFVVQYLLPLVILAALFGLVFLMTQSGGGAAEFAAFSKMGKGKSKITDANRVTFKNVAAAREAVTELQEIVDYLKNPGRYASIGARAPKGVLLVGPPGTGKTLLARAVAGEAGVPFYSMSGSEFVESLVGVGAARVRDLFKKVRESAPAILFIDELDAAGRQRGAGMGQGNDEREQTLNQMLVEMDGFSAAMGITVLGATNRPDILDSALLRPGRFDRQVVVDAPDVEGRVEILNLYFKNRPLGAGVDPARIARQTPGMTGAELANLVNEAALVAVRAGRVEIMMEDLEEAVDRVIAGPQRRSHVLTPEEKRLVACHESGHALVAASVAMKAGVQKLSIVARGRSLGHTTTYQISDRMVLSGSDLRRQITAIMGGLAAEQMIFGEISTGSEGDLRQATALARNMVASYGMGELIGRVAVAQKSGEVFLGRDFSKMQEVSPSTLETVDREIRLILDEAEARAVMALETNRALLDEMMATLIERETLSGPPLEAMLHRVEPPAPTLMGTAVSVNGRPSESRA